MAAKKKKAAASKKKKATTTKAPLASSSGASDRKWKESIWEAPDDVDRLRVWADFLLEQGDPRGELLQLKLLASPTDEQSDKAHALVKKLGGALVGPARPWLRYWTFDDRGLVSFAICEAPKLLEGWEEIAWLHPRLTLEVTSLRKQTMATIAKLVELPLSRIYFLRIESNNLSDRAIAALGPGLRGVRNLSLAHNELTPAGLVAIAPHLSSLEFLCLGPHVSDRSGGATCNAFAEAIAKTPGLHGLKVVYFYRHGKPDDAHVEMLQKLPNMKHVEVSEYPPYDAKTIDALKDPSHP